MIVVTGSFGYIGKYITQGLLADGYEVKTITTHPDKHNPFGEKVKASAYHFDQPTILTETLTGCDTLFNTYWVRFNHRQWSFERALDNTKRPRAAPWRFRYHSLPRTARRFPDLG